MVDGSEKEICKSVEAMLIPSDIRYQIPDIDFPKVLIGREYISLPSPRRLKVVPASQQ